MRYGFSGLVSLAGLAIVLFLTATCVSQETKKKDKGSITEPTEVGGKDFKYWVGKLQAKDHGEREDAMKAVCMFGPNTAYGAIPKIIDELNKTGLDLSVKVNGIMALTTLLKQAWMSRKDGPDVKYLADAQKVFKKALTDDQAITRVRALQGIPWLGPVALNEIEDVVKASRYASTWEVRKEGLTTLVIVAAPDGKGGPPGLEKAKTRLKEAVTDPCYHVRQTAVQGLAALHRGSGVVPIELYLKGATEGRGISDPSPDVRLAALNSLAALKDELKDKDIKDTRSNILKSLNARVADKNPLEKNTVLKIWTHATYLTIAGNLDKSAHLEALLGYFQDSDAQVRATAISAIANFGAKNPQRALVAVLGMLVDKEPGVAQTALSATVQMQHFGPVLGKLKDKSLETRLNSLQLITLAGPDARKDCAQLVIVAINQAILNSADNALCKHEKEQETALAEAGIATLVNIHSFEARSFIEQIAKNKNFHENLREAARDALDDLTKLEKEKEKKK